MAKVLIPFKGEAVLKEAIRVVAFNQGHSNSSKTVYDIVSEHPEIKKQIKKLKQSCKH